MKELNFLMPDFQKEKKSIFGRRRIRTEKFRWHGFCVNLYLAPRSAVESGRLLALVKKQLADAADLWIASELTGSFLGYRQPLPAPELSAFLLGQQPFREILILLVDQKPDIGKKWWQECFLEESFRDLNGLYVVGEERKGEPEAFFDWLYEQSGLLTCFTDTMPVTDGKKTVVVDIRQEGRIERKLPPGCLYLDLTSDPEKERLFCKKVTDISYISARNYLDTAFKARYNAI